MNEDVPICHCAEYYGSHAPDCPIAAEVRALRKDRERLDWLDAQTSFCEQGTGWIARDSTTGRGYQLHETSGEWNGIKPSNTVREAIDAAMALEGRGDGK